MLKDILKSTAPAGTCTSVGVPSTPTTFETAMSRVLGSSQVSSVYLSVFAAAFSESGVYSPFHSWSTKTFAPLNAAHAKSEMGVAFGARPISWLFHVSSVQPRVPAASCSAVLSVFHQPFTITSGVCLIAMGPACAWPSPPATASVRRRWSWS